MEAVESAFHNSHVMDLVSVSCESSGEMLQEGGPLTCHVRLNNVPLEGLFAATYRFSSDEKKLLIPRVHVKNNRRSLSSASRTNYSIVVVDLDRYKFYESMETYPQLYIHHMENSMISFFTTAGVEKLGKVIEFNPETFKEVELI